MKNTKLEYKTTRGKVIRKIDFYRVLKRSYSIFIRKAMSARVCNDASPRAHYLPLNFLNYVNDPYYFSIALSPKFSADEYFVILAWPPSNFTKTLKSTLSKQSYISYTKSNSSYQTSHSNKITKESIDLCATRLKNIKSNKKKKYINLTKDFLTDPSFLFLAYNLIKSKPSNTTKKVDFEILYGINCK